MYPRRLLDKLPNWSRLRFRILIFPLRLFYSLLYHSLAWTYDWVAEFVSLGMWQDWILSILPYISPGRILEIGHGTGHLQLALKYKSEIVVGLDFSQQMGKITRRRMIRTKQSPLLIRAEAQHIPCRNDYFDQIIATFPSEFIFDKLTLVDVLRCLKPEGDLIIIPYACITGSKITHRAAAWLFKITGEVADIGTSLMECLLHAGFLVETQNVRLENSEILIVLAKKPTNP